MRLTSYFLPNLIFLLFIVLAWINIDWVKKTFDYLEEQSGNTAAGVQEGPVLILYDGVQEYSSPPDDKSAPELFYTMKFALLQAYSNNSIQVDAPDITGYTQGTNGREDFSIKGSTMTSDNNDKLHIQGAPADFSFVGAEGKAIGSAANIIYDTDAMYWLLTSDTTSTSNILWTTADGDRINTKAKSIGVSQTDKTSQLSEQVEIDYSQAGDKLVILSDSASINSNSDEIILSGQVRLQHRTANKLITASARRGSYKPNQELILSGNAKIQNQADGSSISADRIFYDTQSLTWRVLAKDNPNNADTDKIQDKIEIIIPQ